MSAVSLNLLVAFFCILLAASDAGVTSRILDGEEAEVLAFPYVVSIRVDGSHICGGTIVGSRFIVTAAHCVSETLTTPVNPSRVKIRAGSINLYAGGNLYAVANIYINDQYDSLMNDVAVLELALDLELSEKMQIIPFAEDDDDIVAGDPVTVAGWGSDDDDGLFAYKLHFQTAEIVDERSCEEDTGYGKPYTLCVKSPPLTGACFGDGGGPAVHNGVLVGVSNFVIGACGTVYPDIFARISYYSSWINSIIKAE